MKLLDSQMVIWINYVPHLANNGWPHDKSVAQKLTREEADPLIEQQNLRTAEWMARVLQKDGFNKTAEFLKTCHPLMTDEESATVSEFLCLKSTK
jgi:hypothetical protein